MFERVAIGTCRECGHYKTVPGFVTTDEPPAQECHCGPTATVSVEEEILPPFEALVRAAAKGYEKTAPTEDEIPNDLIGLQVEHGKLASAHLLSDTEAMVKQLARMAALCRRLGVMILADTDDEEEDVDEDQPAEAPDGEEGGGR